MGTPLRLDHILPSLASPDSGRPLVLTSSELQSRDGQEHFPLRKGLPLLFPSKLHPYLGEAALEIPFGYYPDAFLQYALITSIKQNNGALEHNSRADDPWYLKHVAQSRHLLRSATGRVLDIGCDDPALGASFFPSETQYLGMDTLYSKPDRFRVIGFAEFLPFQDNTFDNVCLLTSLDHVFDYKRSVSEAKRVLKPGGRLYLATLVWNARMELYHDIIHFHHFCEYEIMGVLSGFTVMEVNRYPWKNDAHRDGMYLEAKKNT